MELLAIVIGLIGLGAVIGFTRAMRLLDWEIAALLAVPGLSAFVCLSISDSKTGYYLAGLMGMIAGIVLLCILGGMVLGGAVALLLRYGRGWPASPASPAMIWLNRLMIYGVSLVAILLSLSETGTGGSGHH